MKFAIIIRSNNCFFLFQVKISYRFVDSTNADLSFAITCLSKKIVLRSIIPINRCIHLVSHMEVLDVVSFSCFLFFFRTIVTCNNYENVILFLFLQKTKEMKSSLQKDQLLIHAKYLVRNKYLKVKKVSHRSRKFINLFLQTKKNASLEI